MRHLLAAVLVLGGASMAAAQTFPITPAELADSAAMPRAMPALAAQVAAVYRESEPRTSLDNLFRLQIVAGRFDEAARTLAELRALRTAPGTGATAQAHATNIQYEIYARARALEAAGGRSFAEGFAQAFRETFARLDDRTSAMVARALSYPHSTTRNILRGAVAGLEGKTEISLPEALRLLRAVQVEESFRSFAPLAPALVAEDDRRRYVVERDVRIPAPDGATLCALVVRPRGASARLPTLMEFTIYSDTVATMNEARRTASNGYVGVEAFTRGKACSPDAPVPFEHDGTDAAAVIGWIAAQPWSDGRVGMFGGSYNGFTQWAAAKHMPPALKAIMPSVTVAPGIDIPMEGSVFQNFFYSWPFHAAVGPGVDYAVSNDWARWQRLNQAWYTGGRAYRDLERIDSVPNPFFARWLQHPGYDAYWQRMIPYREEFARIRIPVLTTTGYYDGSQIGALYYLNEHYRYNPAAEHYLVIGPYDHVRGQRGTASPLGDEFEVLRGYPLDPAARIDIGELRYQWFDHVLRGAPRPALLRDRINHQVMGADAWKHAPSLAAMSSGRRRLYLGTAADARGRYPLGDQPPAGDASILQTVDLADRGDAERVLPGNGMFDDTLDTWNSVAFVSEPFQQAADLSGPFSGRLEFVTNKRDLDLYAALFELTPEGKYLWLTYYMARASYARERSVRRLLVPGERQRFDFTSGRMTSRRFRPGSRLVVVLSVLRQPDMQINYGSGKDVSDETIADAGEPLQIRWLGGSFIEVPLSP